MFIHTRLTVAAAFQLILVLSANAQVSTSASSNSRRPRSSCSVEPAAVNFGQVLVGGQGNQTVTVGNNGTTSFTLNEASVSGNGFSVRGPSLPMSLAAGQNVSFTGEFKPLKAGNLSGSISFSSTAANSPVTVSLSGVGITRLLTVSPGTLNFGTVILENISGLTVTATNAGTGAVTITQTSVGTAEFNIAGPSLPLSLASGQSANFVINFVPTQSGVRVDQAAITSNATNSPAIVMLSGTGTHAVILSWDASTSTGVVGYNVYRGAVSGGPYSRVNSGLVPSLTYTDTSVQGGDIYYYVVTAVNSSNAESGYSNQAAAVIPAT